MRRLICLALLALAVPAAADLTLDADSLWLARAQRATGWHLGLDTLATPQQVAAEILSWYTTECIERQERAHGIDPATGEADPAQLVADLVAERAQKEAAAAALVAVTAERDSLKAVLAAPKAAEPMIEEVPAELTP